MMRPWRFLPLVLWGCASPTPPTPASNVASITFSADSLVADSLPILAGDTTSITVHALDANGQPVTGITFSWSSSDTTVATVSSTGLVTAVNPGDADISVAVSSASSNRVSVARPTTDIRAARVSSAKVHAKVHANLIITPATAEIDIGGTVDYTAIAVNKKDVQQWGDVVTTFTSSRPAVATVTADGHAVGVQSGHTLITGTAVIGKKTVTGVASLTVTNCGGITDVPSWVVYISVSWAAGPVTSGSATITTNQSSSAKATLTRIADSVWQGVPVGTASVNNTAVDTTTTTEQASGAPLTPQAYVELVVTHTGSTCYYDLIYQDNTTYTASNGKRSATLPGPLGYTDVIGDLPPSKPTNGWDFSGNLSLPATTAIDLSLHSGLYIPTTGIGTLIAAEYPSTTSAQVSYQLSEVAQ
jgi:hypothetical protein